MGTAGTAKKDFRKPDVGPRAAENLTAALHGIPYSPVSALACLCCLGGSLAPKLRLPSIEHEKEKCHAETTKGINERREQPHTRNQSPHGIEDIRHKRPD